MISRNGVFATLTSNTFNRNSTYTRCMPSDLPTCANSAMPRKNMRNGTKITDRRVKVRVSRTVTEDMVTAATGVRARRRWAGGRPRRNPLTRRLARQLHTVAAGAKTLGATAGRRRWTAGLF